MKRIAVVLAVALVGVTLGATLVAAQPLGRPGMGGPGWGNNAQGAQQQAAPQTVTIEGKLVFIDSYPAVQAKDKTYILRMPRFYYYAYTDGIKEGAQVKAEGYVLPAFPGQDKPFFDVTKATIGSKTYDLAELAQAGFGRGMHMMPGRGGMMGARGGRW